MSTALERNDRVSYYAFHHPKICLTNTDALQHRKILLANKKQRKFNVIATISTGTSPQSGSDGGETDSDDAMDIDEDDFQLSPSSSTSSAMEVDQLVGQKSAGMLPAIEQELKDGVPIAFMNSYARMVSSRWRCHVGLSWN